MTADSHDEFDEEPGRPSKSRAKRECAELEALGETLIAMPVDKLRSFKLPDAVSDAIAVARSISSHGALRRQRKYIARLLREAADVAVIREHLARLESHHADTIHLQHRLERWRDRLLADEGAAFNAFVAEFPSVDRQKLRQLIRSAHKEASIEAPPRSARLLFKYLRDVMADAGQTDTLSHT